LRDVKTIGYQTTVPTNLDAPAVVVDADLAPEVHAKLAGKPYESDF